MLNPQQQQAAEGLIQFVNERKYPFALLLGPAGSGKTFTVAHVIKQLNLKDRPFVVACPTHKAKRVLVGALQKHGIQSNDSMTVAALIGKAPSSSDDPDEEGKAQWMNNGGETLRSNTLLILDEVSMIDFRDMKTIKSLVERTGSQAILTGDFSQLRPVQGKSIAEAVEKIPVRFALSEVMRSDAGNIVGMSKAIRTTGDIDIDCFDSKTVFAYNNSDQFEQSFLETPDAVAIAYTNKRVGELNQKKREKIYGNSLQDFMVNEEVILTESPLLIDRQGSKSGRFERLKAADNNDQLVVLKCGRLQTIEAPITRQPIPYYPLVLHNPETGLDFEAKGLTYDMYVGEMKPALDTLLARMRDFSNRLGSFDDALYRRAEREDYENTDRKHKTFHASETDIEKFFTAEQKNWLKEIPLTNPKFMGRQYRPTNFDLGTHDYVPMKGNWKSLRKLLWARDYFGFRNEFAVLLYPHASTAHKAQGSTYKHVFVDWPNLMTIRDPDDRQAACYVAVSRASDTLHIRI